MINLEEVTKSYHDNIYALREVSLSIGRGECCFVLGPPGAGKTTLLKLLYGIEPPTGGRSPFWAGTFPA